jgi:hypothetical protein
MNRTIHLVCLDAPSPPDYGGAIDMFYKIRALHQSGHKIRLHFFHYKQGRNTEALEEYCETMHAYNRKSFLQSLPLTKPFIVQSRVNKQLIERLNQDQHSVLLEGLHVAGILPYLNEKERVVIRMHNEEAAYYHHLAQAEKSFFKKKYFTVESRLLRKYQQTMDKDIKLACLSETDMTIFRDVYHFRSLSFIPCFIPWQQVSSKVGRGSYCLYHGNLSVPENEEAAAWLIAFVFSRIRVPLVIAGKGISAGLIQVGRQYSHVSFVNNPSIAEIDKLVSEAHINVLPSMNRTGVKLKLLNALLNGRFCITNKEGVMGSSIQKGLVVLQDAGAWVNAVPGLMEQTFAATHLAERADILRLYNNAANAAKLNAIW